METSELKTVLIGEIGKEFKNPNISPFTHNFEKGMDLFFEVIHHSNFSYELLKSLENVLINEPTYYNSLANLATYLEKYLTRIGYFLNKVPEGKFGLMSLFRKLELHKKYPDFSWQKLAEYENEPNFLAHFCRAYCTRNDIAHSENTGDLPDWNQVEVMQNRNSILVVMVYATLVHYKALVQAIEASELNEQPDIIPYLKQVVADFNKWQKRFVVIHSKEKIELYAHEYSDEIDHKPREESVENLRKDIPKFMLLGDAGMGKTTTLQYLALKDAKQCQENPTQTNIPVYLELKLLTKERTLFQEILRKLPFSSDFSSNLLQTGKINLYLDGLNEVTESKQNVINQIEDLLKRYADISLLVASRNTHRFMLDENNSLPVFAFNKMSKSQIDDFLQRNTKTDILQLIQAGMAKSERLVDWLRVPMLLNMMIEVVDEHKTIPEDKYELIDSFINKIYQREKDRDSNFYDSDTTFDALMVHLALYLDENDKIALKKVTVLDVLSEKISQGFPNADLNYVLKVSVELGILTVDNNIYSFVHEEYLDYYVAKGYDI